MKNRKSLFLALTILVCLSNSISQTLTPTERKAYYTAGMAGTLKPKIQVSGDPAKLKGVMVVNIIYDYSNMSVGEFEKEEDYIRKKMEEYNAKDPERAEKFKENWYNSRKLRYEPKFETLFNKVLFKIRNYGCELCHECRCHFKSGNQNDRTRLPHRYRQDACVY